MFSSIKLKLTSGILLLPIMLQSFPGAALGYDVLGRLRNFVSTQVKTSDGIINPNKLKIKESFQKGADWYEGKWLSGLSLLESKTGLSEENKLYKTLKSYNLFNLGFNAGVVNGAGSLAAETYSLVAKIPTVPERLLNFGFNYVEDSDKYHAMVSNGAQAVAGIALNALPLLEQGKNAYLDAAQDPLKFGHLNGEGAAFLGSFLIGGGQVKALSSANKVGKVAEVASAANTAGKVAGATSAVNKAEKIAPVASLLNKAEKTVGAGTSLRLGVKAPMISSPLASLMSGFKTLAVNQRATTFFAATTKNGAKAAKISDEVADSVKIPESLEVPLGMMHLGRVKLGGTGEMHLYRDMDGLEWLFKPGQHKNGELASYRAYVQEAGYKVQYLVDPASAVPVGVGLLGGKFGAIQRRIPDLDPTIRLKGWQLSPQKYPLPSSVFPQLQREQVTDFLLCNFDPHGGNFIVTKTGKVFGIDKEQSFKHLLDPDSWKIDVTYHPNAVYGEFEPIYYTMYNRFVAGDLDLNLKVPLPYIKRVESVSNSKYAEIFRDYAESRLGAGKAADGMLDLIVERKDLLRQSFDEFFAELLAKKKN